MIIESLPKSLREMAEVIGVTSALAIVAVRGGERLMIPKKATSDHWLNEVIGYDAFIKLSSYYSGEAIDIAVCKQTIRSIHHSYIVGDHLQGLSIATLARKYCYTERGIRKVLSRRIK